MHKNLEILNGLGLSKPEAEAYVALLKMGSTQATDLASEMGLKRTTAYPILDRLEKEGLVTTYKRGHKNYYTPLRPNKLALLYEERLKALVNIVPTLEALENKESAEFGVRFIQSKSELKRFYKDILDEYEGKEYYIIGSAPAWIGLDREFFLDFRRRRAARGIRVKLLLSADSAKEEGQDDESLLREFKYLAPHYKFKSTIDIYDDKVIIVGPEVKALAVVIAIPPMVDIFQSVFKALWDASK
ncbi:MAG: HTH-type transcriptional regulator, sugar sensing transcriptional regulator [Patescibacteria group bacterium]|nr:HTH-type transcriptional regulator, sugar sensing transcriptional regulator [Patescibacteria group bacterium]